LAKKQTWLKTKVRAYLAVSRIADFKQKATSQQPRCTPTSTCKHSQLAIRTRLAYNGLGNFFSMAVHATRRIRKVSVGLERQADSVAVVELAAGRMSDSDDEVINPPRLRASSRMLSLLTKRSAQQRLRSWCRRTLESGVWNQRTMRGRGERRRRT
jgi:hypothetical protein